MCQAQPAPPAVGSDDTALAQWILDLVTSGADCRSKLAAVARIVN